MAYSFEQVFAADPSNPANVARNAAVTIFAPGDIAQTPLTLTTPNGDPLANPLQVNNNGFGSAFMHATLDRVAWAGGNFTGFFTSYEGMKAEAVSARTAAQTAASTAGADAAAVADAAVASVIADADAAAVSAASAASNASASATAAANSAALVGAPADAAIAAAINGTGTATKTALSATIVTEGKKTFTPNIPTNDVRRVVFLGDSITNRYGGYPGAEPIVTVGYAAWAYSYSGCRFQPINHGVGGDTTTGMLARLDAVLAEKPYIVHILAGTNDAGLLHPTATTIANYTAILARLRAAGIKVIIGTIPPRDTYAAGIYDLHKEVNAWIRGLNIPDVHIVDYAGAFVNVADGTALAGNHEDGLHPNAVGAEKMGRLLWPVLEKLLPASVRLFDVENEKGQLLPYGRFSAGTPTALPTGWALLLGGTGVTYNKVPRTDGITGSWFEVTKTDEAASTQITCSTLTLAAAGLAIGDVIQGEIEYDFPSVDATVTKGHPGIRLQFRKADNTTASEAIFFAGATTLPAPGVARKGVMRTYPKAIPADVTSLRLVLFHYNIGVYRWDRAGIRKTTLPVVGQ